MVYEIFGGLVMFITNIILQIISSTGYAGVFFLMILESAVMPVPSEIVMPFAGYLVAQGQFDLWTVVLLSSVGNLVGSIIAYFAGAFIGRKAILKYGKYFLLSKHHLDVAENWFRKHGDKTIFIGRLLPVVRTVISLPAGIARMNFKKFCVYTFVGSIPWNFAMTYIGVVAGENWQLIEKQLKWLDLAVVIGIIVFAIWLFFKLRKRGK